jgi:pre-mRNA 3'-end-processing factor FIP1
VPQRTSTNDTEPSVAPVKKETKDTKDAPSGADLPGIATSKIDINAKPIYEPAGKPITQVNIDEGISSMSISEIRTNGS